jgi:hypothetical protein
MANHPISLRDLQAFDADVRSRIELPRWADSGLGCLGLIFDPALDRHRYTWCTPLNCRTFAGTGDEGVYFSLLFKDGTVGDESPVVVTTPSGDSRSWIVGSNVRDFLALGYYRGYFALEQLSYDQALTFVVFTNKD